MRYESIERLKDRYMVKSPFKGLPRELQSPSPTKFINYANQNACLETPTKACQSKSNTKHQASRHRLNGQTYDQEGSSPCSELSFADQKDHTPVKHATLLFNNSPVLSYSLQELKLGNYYPSPSPHKKDSKRCVFNSQFQEETLEMQTVRKTEFQEMRPAKLVKLCEENWPVMTPESLNPIPPFSSEPRFMGSSKYIVKPPVSSICTKGLKAIPGGYTAHNIQSSSNLAIPQSPKIATGTQMTPTMQPNVDVQETPTTPAFQKRRRTTDIFLTPDGKRNYSKTNIKHHITDMSPIPKSDSKQVTLGNLGLLCPSQVHGKCVSVDGQVCETGKENGTAGDNGNENEKKDEYVVQVVTPKRGFKFR